MRVLWLILALIQTSACWGTCATATAHIAHTDVGLLPDDHVEKLQALEGSYWWHGQRVKWVTDLAKKHASQIQTFADIGTGAGQSAAMISNILKPKKTYLVDPTDYRSDEVKRNPTLEFLAQSAMDLVLPTKADLITSLDVVEHLPHPVEAWKRLKENLSENGVLIATIPAHQFLYSDWDREMGHYRRYSLSGLRNEIEQAGLSVRMMSHMFTLGMPYLVYRRLVPATPNLPKFPGLMEKILQTSSDFERRFAPYFPLPFGSSIIVVASPDKGSR